MTREEAIKILDPETRRETMQKIPVMERIETDQTACRLAVEALRAQQKLLEMLELDRDAWKLCDGCRPNRFFGNRFCCRCGRPLTEEAWAELERRIGGNDETVR